MDYTAATNSQIRVRVQSNDVTSNVAVPVVITAATMARVTSSGNDWTYLVPGDIVNVQPNIGQLGTVVTITGESKQHMLLCVGVKSLYRELSLLKITSYSYKRGQNLSYFCF